MSEEEQKDLQWWAKTLAQTIGVTAIAFAPDILQMFPEQTLLFKLAIPIGVIIKMIAYKYQNNQLPSGLSNIMDRIPDRITGARKK